MRTSLRFAAVAFAAAAFIHPAVAAQIPLTQADADAYRQGHAYERIFQDIDLAPGTCGIVLERALCNRDLELILKIRPPDPSDAAVRAWFATGDIALQVKNWNSSYIPESTWQTDPAFAWWYTAGIASIAAGLPQGSGVDTYLNSLAKILDEHSSAAPGGADAWAFPGSTPYERMATLQAKLEAVVPVSAYPEADFGSGDVAYAQLGVYISTIQQLADNAVALSRPEARAFAAAALARLQQAHQHFNDGLSAAGLQAQVDRPIIAEPAWIDANWREPLSKQINTKWPQEPRYALSLGASVAQLAYNAAVLKDAGFDAQTRAIVAKLTPWPGMPAKTRADLAALLQIPSVANGAKWEDINAAGTAVTLDIVSGS